MKKYETIRCKDRDEVRQVLRDLSTAGFHAVADGRDGLTVTITEVPETEYLLQVWSQGKTRHCRCETLEEAKEIACIFLESGYEYAEICEGYPGEWVQLLHLPEA